MTLFRKATMDTLNSIGYTTEELFSQKGSTSKDAKFERNLCGRPLPTGPPPNDGRDSGCIILL